MTETEAALKEAREALRLAPAALTAAYQEADAEWRNHDTAGSKHNATVRRCREQIATALAKIDSALSITGEGK